MTGVVDPIPFDLALHRCQAPTVLTPTFINDVYYIFDEEIQALDVIKIAPAYYDYFQKFYLGVREVVRFNEIVFALVFDFRINNKHIAYDRAMSVIGK